MNKIDDPKKRIAAAIIDGFIYIFYLASKLCGKRTPFKEDLKQKDFKKILVIRMDHIGDVVITTPIYRALRTKYPQAQIDTVIGSWSQGVLKYNKDLTNIMVFDAPWFQEVRSDQGSVRNSAISKFRAIWELVKKLKAVQYDLVIDPRSDFRHIFYFGYLADAKHILSFERSGGAYLLSTPMPFDPHLHELKKGRLLLSALGIDNTGTSSKIDISPLEENKMDKLLSDNGFTGRKIIVIAPGARKALKLWPVEKFCTLTTWLLGQNPDAVIIFVGGKGESQISDRLDQEFSNEKRVLNLIEKTNLLESFVLLKRSQLIITHDGPLSHMATDLPNPMVVLFGPTETERFKPLREKTAVITKNFECSPCLLRTCHRNGSTTVSECMKAITEDDIKKAVLELLK
ncbi:MAG: glycosyltransferase family 9 protein [Candidatus Omnitrophica bacterium]|nr:glycosyltransferase family 9 protein [Candidatus Omnitrophota bacterium]